MPGIDDVIENKIGEVRTDAFDMTFGELISLYESREFEIRPEFQRLFRWEHEQRSRLIESILLNLPIPQIFVIENQNGVLELIDGLQRISSIIQFISPQLLLAPNNEPLKLRGCDLVSELNGIIFDDLPVALRMRLKRTTVRVVVIKRQSTKMLRYEMFKRLNTGGATLSEQEIRNCTSRMVGDEGTRFYQFLIDSAADSSFKNTISTLPEPVKEKRGDEELVLRFLALKNSADTFKGSVVDWLNNYMEGIILGFIPFDYEKEQRDFVTLFKYIDFVLGEGAFVRYRGQQAIGALAPAYFEAVTMGVWRALSFIQDVPTTQVKKAIVETVQSYDFRDNVGSGSNSLTKFRQRIGAIEEALKGLKQ